MQRQREGAGGERGRAADAAALADGRELLVDVVAVGAERLGEVLVDLLVGRRRAPCSRRLSGDVADHDGLPGADGGRLGDRRAVDGDRLLDR